MQFNFQFPARAVKHWATWIGPRHLGDLAVAAEAAGFDIVSTTDHPFPNQQWLDNGGHHAFDPFVSLSFMAAATSRIKLLTFILVAGYRNPYLAAKSAASLDLLSGGRLVVGMGAGYQQGEFDVLGASFPDRGKRFDASIRAMRAAWTGEVVDRDDPYFPAHGHAMLPPPAQPLGPPVWIGGNSPAAMRRVAELADGWLPFEQRPAQAAVTATPVLAADDLGEKISAIRAMRTGRGRPAEFDVCFSPETGRDPEGNVEMIAAQVEDLERAGVTHVSIESRARSVDECLAELELYGRTVVAGRSLDRS